MSTGLRADSSTSQLLPVDLSSRAVPSVIYQGKSQADTFINVEVYGLPNSHQISCFRMLHSQDDCGVGNYQALLMDELSIHAKDWIVKQTTIRVFVQGIDKIKDM